MVWIGVNLTHFCFLHVVHKCLWEDTVSAIFVRCPSSLTAIETLFVGIHKVVSLSGKPQTVLD